MKQVEIIHIVNSNNLNISYFNLNEMIYISLNLPEVPIELFIGILLCGLFLKIAAAPFHSWVLDVYENSPSSSTLIFASVTKVSILVVIIKICYYCYYKFFITNISQFISFVGIFSVFIGSIFGLTERKLKSLLTLSSINNIGYLLLAITSSAKSSIQTLFIYLINYLNANLALWSILITIQFKRNRYNYTKKLNKDFSDIISVIKRNATLTSLFLIIIFSIAGIPPFIGFLAKLSIILLLIENYSSLTALVLVLLNVISSFYYLRIIKISHFEELLTLTTIKLNYDMKATTCFLHILLSFFIIYQTISPWMSFLFSQRTLLC